MTLSDPTTILNTATVTVSTAQSLQVTTAQDYARAGEFVTGLKSLKKQIVEFFEADIDRAFKLHRSLTKKRNDATGPLDAEVDRLGRAMVTWKQEQDRFRKLEEARIAAEEQERSRVLALEQASILEHQGLAADAEAVVEEAIAAPAPVVVLPSSVPDVAGVSYRDVPCFEVVDVSKVPHEFLVVDTVKLGRVVRAMNGQVVIPGVRVWVDKRPVVRT